MCAGPPDGAVGCWRKVTRSQGGARRGASERQYRAITGDVERLRLLAGPLPATSGDWQDLYGMQEVWGSNPHSSTFLQLKGML
jgi:hypothetical protein